LCCIGAANKTVFLLVKQMSYKQTRRAKQGVFRIKLRTKIFSDQAEELEEKFRTLLRSEGVAAQIDDSITGNTTTTDDREDGSE
jgi:hypothetical protein